MPMRRISLEGSDSYSEITSWTPNECVLPNSDHLDLRSDYGDDEPIIERIVGGRSSDAEYNDIASISIEAQRKRSCSSRMLSKNNHNLPVNWENLDKKEFMKTVSTLNVEDLFDVVVADRVRLSDGSKNWAMSEYVLQRKDRRIFVGGQGFVLFVRRSQHSSSLAMKVCLHSSCKARMERYRAKAELQTSAQKESKFISDLLVYYMTEKFFISVMYKAKHSSLKVIKREIGSFPAKYIKYYAVCIADALQCLHRMAICHKDVKADNVLIDHRGLPQLADFGLAVASRASGDCYSANRRVTTMQYYPPECLCLGGRVNDFKVDSWLFGFFLCELSVPSNSHMWSKFRGSEKAGWRFRLCDSCCIPPDENLGKLMRSLLRAEPAERPPMRDVARHSYFDGYARSLLQMEAPPSGLHVANLMPKGKRQLPA